MAALTSAGEARVDGSSLAVLRIVYGAVGCLSAARLLSYGWVDSLYAMPAYHFTYLGFDWVRPPPGWGMRGLVVASAVAAVLVALGRWYRPAIITFWVFFTWIELIDVSTYLNHYWFMTAVGAVMIVAPMASDLSLDARRRCKRQRCRSPAGVAAAWVWLYRAQVAVVYLFAGVAKLNEDWLLGALPLRLWLPARADLVAVGPLLELDGTAYVLSWAGALFDCTIVGFLLWRRSRLGAWSVLVAFHVATWVLFPIGVFPWLMIGMSTIFFDAHWPGRLIARIRPRAAINRVGAPPHNDIVVAASRARPPIWVAAAVVWIVFQYALPLRHHLYPGDARWTGEGYRFAWNVLASEKSGSVSFRVTDTVSGRTRTESAAELYTPMQWRTMASDPELIRQAAHHLADREREKGITVEVRADAFVSLNGSPARRLVDPNVDLANELATIAPRPWILL